MFKILIDADACPKPIKEIIYRAAINRKVLTLFVANQYLSVPDSDYITTKIVAKGFDIADNYIVEKTNPNDLIITSDIPLADLVIAKGGIVITPHGRKYDHNNIKPVLAKRNFMTQMRDSGMIQTKTKAFSNKENYAFATMLDTYLTKVLSS